MKGVPEGASAVIPRLFCRDPAAEVDVLRSEVAEMGRKLRNLDGRLDFTERLIGGALPLTYYLRILRGILLKGVGPAMFWEELVALAVFATVILGLASLRLRRQWA